MKHTLETIEKIRQARLRQKDPRLGKTHTLESRLKMSKVRKGKNNSVATQFKAGQKPWNYGLRIERKKKPHHYTEIHMWLKYHYGKAKKCNNKFCSGDSKNYHWALIKGEIYKRERKIFTQLCAICHQLYDKSNKKSYHFHTVFLYGRHLRKGTGKGESVKNYRQRLK